MANRRRKPEGLGGGAPLKPEQPARELRVAHEIELGVPMEKPAIVHRRELSQLQIRKISHDPIRIEDTMRIEADARPADRNGKEQMPAGRKNAPQLIARARRAVWIERIAVPAETDMLRHVQAG